MQILHDLFWFGNALARVNAVSVVIGTALLLVIQYGGRTVRLTEPDKEAD